MLSERTPALGSRPSLLVVVQRYGDGVAGGAEAHARMLVNKLKPHLDVEVATTTARDYWTWENEFSAGLTWVDHVPVRRFPVERTRSRMFKAYERRAFRDGRSLEDELSFVDAQGPVAPDLTEHLFRHGHEFDHVLFFTYIYWTTLFGLPVVPERSVLVPTAHDEPAIGLSLYRRVFHLPRAIAFNTAEERAMVHRRFANSRVPNEIVGVGVDVPEDLNGATPRPSNASVAARAERFRAKHGIEGPFFLYLGRIVESKGLQDLWDLWGAWRSPAAPRATLVLAGHKEMEIPKRADIQYVGEVGEDEKWDAFAACTALVVPEKLQSLSLVTLEAWSVGRPVICPAAAPVLASMSRRASAGVPYRTRTEFAEICELLAEKPEIADRLGRLGREFVSRAYTWPVVVEKYLDLFAEVRARNGANGASPA